MIDLHCHMLPGIDDGAADLDVSLGMAEASVADGVSVLACTPHILPGLYHNSGPQIRRAIHELQKALDQEGIPLRLVTGADNHVVPDFVAGLQSGRLLSLCDSRYVLVEPPHHTEPPQLEDFFFQLACGGVCPHSHPSRTTNLGAVALRNHPAAGSGRCLDADYVGLGHWRFRSNSAILGRADAGRGVRSYPGDRCA